MNESRQIITDELLEALVDGELDAATRERIEAAAGHDAQLAARIGRIRGLRAQLQAHFAPVLAEPVPLALQAAAAGRRPDAPRRRALQWFALAATVAAVALLGVMYATRAPLQPWQQRGGQLVAEGALRRALMEDLSQQATGDMQMILSIRTRDGELCRSFAMAGQAGLACLRGGEWIIDVVADVPPSMGAYRPAASALPEPVRQTIEARIEDEPLTVEQEAAARASGWSAAPANE